MLALLDGMSADKVAVRFGVNVIAHYWTLQAFMPAMIKKDKGHVVTIASMASFLSMPGMVPYCNSKAAVMSLHEGMKHEMRFK